MSTTPKDRVTVTDGCDAFKPFTLNVEVDTPEALATLVGLTNRSREDVMRVANETLVQNRYTYRISKDAVDHDLVCSMFDAVDGQIANNRKAFHKQ